MSMFAHLCSISAVHSHTLGFNEGISALHSPPILLGNLTKLWGLPSLVYTHLIRSERIFDWSKSPVLVKFSLKL